MSKWGGSKARAWTAAVLREYGRTCALNLPGCTVLATTGDHKQPRSVAPHLEYVVSNGQPACMNCNQRRSARPLDTPPRVDDSADLFDSRQ